MLETRRRWKCTWISRKCVVSPANMCGKWRTPICLYVLDIWEFRLWYVGRIRYTWCYSVADCMCMFRITDDTHNTSIHYAGTPMIVYACIVLNTPSYKETRIYTRDAPYMFRYFCAYWTNINGYAKHILFAVHTECEKRTRPSNTNGFKYSIFGSNTRRLLICALRCCAKMIAILFVFCTQNSTRHRPRSNSDWSLIALRSPRIRYTYTHLCEASASVAETRCGAWRNRYTTRRHCSCVCTRVRRRSTEIIVIVIIIIIASKQTAIVYVCFNRYTTYILV